MVSENRIKLRQAQTALAFALRGNVGVPSGFDSARVALAATALRSKRLHAAARAWPELKRSLGDDFVLEFEEYASGTATPVAPREDALAFARYLARKGSLPAAFRKALKREQVRKKLNWLAIRSKRLMNLLSSRS
jgi:hypothetical protein